MNISSNKAVVVLSGGQDSTYCLGVAVAQYGADNVTALTFNYGQRHERELLSARTVATLFGVYHRQVNVPDILHSTSPLTSDNELETYESFDQMTDVIGDRVEHTFIPMRNDLFLTLAANRAVAMGAATLFTGVCESDTANYPDCRARFIDSKVDAMNLALGLDRPDYRGAKLNIRTPLMYMGKSAMCRAALDVPGVYYAWAWSHTAYDGQYPPVGRDHASVLRAEGFREAGLPDPLVVRAYLEGLMDLPAEGHYHLPDIKSVAELCDWVGAAPLQ